MSTTFLDHFADTLRGAVGGDFALAVRAGISNPSLIVAAVDRRATAQAERDRERGSDDTRACLLAMALADYPDEAIALAVHYVELERLSPEERQVRKAQQGQHYAREWMAKQPATPKQLDFLKRLGHAGPVGDRAAASVLIDSLLAQKGAVR